MIVRRFLLWARSAPAAHRAEATASLVHAYLYADLNAVDRDEAETALTAMLDDPSPMVRRALSEGLAAAPDVPHHVILTLAADGSDVAEPVLANSPLLLDSDLVDAAALGDGRAQAAIASRPYLSLPVAGALAEIASPDALAVLAANPTAEIGEASLFRIVERHGNDGPLREALLARDDLPVAVRQAVSVALARSLGDFVTACGWLSAQRSERVGRESCERAAVVLSAGSDSEETVRLVAHLRETSQLTPGLMLRALLSGQGDFVEAAFADLSGLPAARVRGILRDASGSGFAALYGRAGLPVSLRAAFGAGLVALSERGTEHGPEMARLSRHHVRRTLRACSDLPANEASRLVALLRRFEAEAARDDARQHADALADEAALEIVRRYAPQELEGEVVAA